MNVHRRNRLQLLACGLLIGMASISFPSLGNVFKDQAEYALTPIQYGLLFIVQSAAAVTVSLWSARLSKRFALPTLLGASLAFGACAMIILAITCALPPGAWLKTFAPFIASGLAGAGVGLGISVLNVLVSRAWPDSDSKGVTALHTLIGAGLATGPVIVAAAIAMGHWWYATVLIGATLCFLAGFCRPEATAMVSPVSEEAPERLSSKVYLYGMLAFLYGASEAVFSNWCVIYLHQDIQMPLAWASAALSVFWVTLTLGRLAFFSLTSDGPRNWAALASPWAMTGAFIAVALAEGSFAGVGTFALAGAACACFYPAVLGRATSIAGEHRQFVSGLMVSTVLLGAGAGTHLTAFLIEHFSLDLSRVFICCAVVPVVLAALTPRALRRDRGRRASTVS